mgnify:CR=1 FL=1
MRILCTGATGMLGQELVPLLLKAGHEVYALSRKLRKSSHIHYIKGDVTKPSLGIDHVEVDAVLHMAALTSLRERNKEDLFIQNYLGTQNVVQYCKEHEIKRLFYISTVYVCGTEVKNLKEEKLPPITVFRNRYEESKYRAENYVYGSKLDYTVFRPGILVGRYSDGRSKFFQGFYRPIKAIVAAHSFAEQKLKFPRREVLESKLHLPTLHLPMRLYGDPNSTLALTPVDFAAEAIAKRLDDSSIGKIYNVVPDRLPTLLEVTDSVSEVLGIKGYHPNMERTVNPLDMFYNRMVRDFHPYLHDHPTIETSIGHECPKVDKGYLMRIVAYWRAHDSSTDKELADVELAEKVQEDYDEVAIAGV